MLKRISDYCNTRGLAFLFKGQNEKTLLHKAGARFTIDLTSIGCPSYDHLQADPFVAEKALALSTKITNNALPKCNRHSIPSINGLQNCPVDNVRCFAHWILTSCTANSSCPDCVSLSDARLCRESSAINKIVQLPPFPSPGPSSNSSSITPAEASSPQPGTSQSLSSPQPRTLSISSS